MATTIRDVALRAGTSIAAASHTLNGRSGGSIRVGTATRERILKAAAELGYTPHPIARSLATGRTHAIGLALPYATAFIDQNPFCTQVMHGVFNGALAHRYNLMLLTAWEDEGTLNSHALDCGQKVDGLVLVLPDPNSRLVAGCRALKIPCVSVVAPPMEGFSTVNADDEAAGYLATHHLLSLGHRRIAFLTGIDAVCTSKPRLDGYLRALRERGMFPDHRYFVQAGFDTRIGYTSMAQLLRLPPDERPTAVIAINDLCASGALMAVREAGLRVPEDIAVVGIDDTEFCETTRPTLTSVRMSIDKLGSTAVRKLVELIEGRSTGETDTVLPVSLTVRQSCGGADRRPEPALGIVAMQAESMRSNHP